jgi:O-antigen/teichoic acid export membrane protein
LSIKRQSLWTLLPLLVNAAVGFVSLPLFLRFFGNDLYALWSYVAILGGMFGFSDMGVGVSVGRYIGVALGRNDHESVRGYWGTGNAIILPFLTVTSLLFIILGVWLGPMWFNVSSANVGLLRSCFVAGGFGLFFSYYGNHWMILSQAYLDFKFISMVRLFFALLQIIPALLLAALTHNPLLVTAWGALASALQLLVFVWHARHKYQIGFHFRAASMQRLREMAAFVGKTFAALVSGSLFGPIDRVLLGRLALPADFSPYVFCSNATTRLQSLSTSVMCPVLYNTARVVGDMRGAAAKIYNETFAFIFDWYLLAALWIGLWHPVLLRLWLTHTMGASLGLATAAKVGPLLVPLVIACCLSAMSAISSAQLPSINRMGAAVIFSIVAGLSAVAGVWIGWHIAGVVGAAYGYMFSRLALVAQDLFIIRLLKAGGWLAPRTWFKFAAQCLVAAALASAYWVFPATSCWLLIPAACHAALVAAFLLRQPLGKMLTGVGDWQKSLSSAARK